MRTIPQSVIICWKAMYLDSAHGKFLVREAVSLGIFN
jgi:hypothetical protein